MRPSTIAVLALCALLATGTTAIGLKTAGGSGGNASKSQYKPKPCPKPGPGGIQGGGGANPGKKGAWPPNSTGNSGPGNSGPGNSGPPLTPLGDFPEPIPKGLPPNPNGVVC